MAMTAGLSKTEMVDEERIITRPWQVFFRDFDSSLTTVAKQEAILQVPPEGSPPQNDSISVRSMAAGPLAGGLYRIHGYVRIVKPAAVSSSVLVSIFFYDGGVACNLTLVLPVTGNTTSSGGTGTVMIRSDEGKEISYATTYASDAANAMEYSLALVLERLGGQ